MGNSIRQPRRRPRQQSCSFVALWWCVRREAALQVFVRQPELRAAHRIRLWLAEMDTPRLTRLVQRTLADHPARRYFP
jgi:hypothetical protein